MKSKRRTVVERAAFAALITTLFWAAGCSAKTPSSGAGQTVVEKEMSFTYESTQPNTLNMIVSMSNLDSYIFYHVEAMLFRSYNGIKEPEICDTWELSEDRLIYTYHLKDARWSDGSPLTAEHFAYFFISRLDPEMGSGNAKSIITSYGIKNAERFNRGECTREEVGVKALDNNTLQLTLEQPLGTFDGMPAIYPLREEFVKAKGQAFGGTPADLEYSGPYILTEWVYDNYLKMEKNPQYIYAGSSFPVQHITMVQIPDTNTKIAMYENGEIDVIGITPEYYSLVPDEEIKTFPWGAMGHIQLNVHGKGNDPKKAALLSNKNFRLALSYALDRTAILKAVAPDRMGINRFASGIFPGRTASNTYITDYPVNAVPVSGDAARAKEHFAQALSDLGYSSAAQLPVLSYLTFNAPAFKAIGEAVVDQWKQTLGITTVEINLQPVPMAIQAMMGFDYDIYYTQLGSEEDPSSALTGWITGGSYNDPASSGKNLFVDPEFDALVAKTTAEPDRLKRMELTAQAEQMLIDRLSLIPFAEATMTEVIHNWVEGYTFNALDGVFSFKNLRVNK
jgi:oligopeptide transport system substrate-binding protein